MLWLCAGEYRGAKTVKAFIRYCLARYKEDQAGKAYRIYVTDALRHIAQNTAKYVGGTYTKKRFVEVIEPPKKEKQVESPDEVKARILKKLRGR